MSTFMFLCEFVSFWSNLTHLFFKITVICSQRIKMIKYVIRHMSTIMPNFLLAWLFLFNQSKKCTNSYNPCNSDFWQQKYDNRNRKETVLHSTVSSLSPLIRENAVHSLHTIKRLMPPLPTYVLITINFPH